MTSSRSNRYSTDIATLAKLIAERYPQSADASQDVLIHLALAFAAVERLEEKGADLELSGRHLISPAIERAYREAMYVRQNLPPDWLDISTISRFGRATLESKNQSHLEG